MTKPLPIHRSTIALLLTLLSACGGGKGNPAGPSAPTPTPAPDATIGPAGGTVTAFGGAVRLVIPANALATPTGITIRTTSQVPLDPHAVAGSAYQVGPAGTTFATAATLSVHYDASQGPSGVPESDLRVHVLGGASTWETLAQSTTDSGGNEASGAITTAGIYGVRWLGPRSACSSAKDGQFDFWLGTWDYHEGNLPPATNEITKEGSGCLIEEHYQDPTGVQGRSVSLVSRQDGLWHQTYIDSRGGRIVLVGSLEGKRMVLDQSATDRTTWDPLDADTVRYFAERTSDGGQTWSLVLDASYTRR